jgi:type IV secretory pathway protease TraF
VILALALGPPVRDQLLCNHSLSTPVGLYLRTEGPIERGAIVAVRAAEVASE